MRSVVVVLAVVVATTACRSPFAKPDDQSGRVGQGTHAWPLYESAPHGAGWRWDVLWPGASLVRTEGDGENRTDLLWPIFSHSTEERRELLAVRPIFDLRKVAPDEDGTGAGFALETLLGLWSWKDHDTWHERRMFPFLDYEDHDGEGHLFVPLVYGREWDGAWRRSWVAPPLFGRSWSEQTDHSGWDFLWPLFHYDTSDEAVRARALPLVWYEADADAHAKVYFPLWWDIADDDSSFFMAFPFYGRQVRGDDFEAVSYGGPLYIGIEDGDETQTNLLWPIFNSTKSPDEWSWRVFPVLWRGEDEHGGHTHIWPLFGWSRHDDRRTASVAWPFLSTSWDDDSWSLNFPWPLVKFSASRKRDLARIWPLFEANAHPGSTNGNVLLHAVEWSSDEEADSSDFRILWRLLESSRAGGKDTFALNPLFRHESNDDGDVHWSLLFGLLERTREGGTLDWDFLWFL